MSRRVFQETPGAGENPPNLFLRFVGIRPRRRDAGANQEKIKRLHARAGFPAYGAGDAEATGGIKYCSNWDRIRLYSAVRTSGPLMECVFPGKICRS